MGGFLNLSTGLTSEGSILLSSNLLNSSSSIIQQKAGNLYIDNTLATASSINIGKINADQTIYIGSTTSAPYIYLNTNGGGIAMSSYAETFVINSANTMINGSGALLTLGNANGTVNVKGGLTVNAIGGTTVGGSTTGADG